MGTEWHEETKVSTKAIDHFNNTDKNHSIESIYYKD